MSRTSRPAAPPATSALAALTFALAALILTLAAPATAQETPATPLTPAAAQIPSPEDFFGHRMGADRQLAHWPQLVEYYELIDAASDRVHVVHMGPSTLGEPFLSIFVSSPENLARLDDFQRMNAVLQDPRGHTEDEIDDAIMNGKVVFVQSYALHSTEVAGSQSPAEIMYLFATRDDDEIHEILDNTISILIPAFNPDGVGIVNEWYDRWVGTEYEGASPPELYHHYIGHDIRRDRLLTRFVQRVSSGINGVHRVSIKALLLGTYECVIELLRRRSVYATCLTSIHRVSFIITKEMITERVTDEATQETQRVVCEDRQPAWPVW